MARTPFAPMASPLPEHSDDLDIFADVSHHGASLFTDLLTPALDHAFSPTPPLSHSALQPAVSDSTAPLSEHPHSVSTSSAAASHPAVSPFTPNLPTATADSYSPTNHSELLALRKNTSPQPTPLRPSKAPLSAPPTRTKRPIDPNHRKNAKNLLHSPPKQGPGVSSLSKRAPFPPNKVIAKSAKVPKPTSPTNGKTSVSKRKRPNATLRPSGTAKAIHDSEGSERTDDVKRQRSPGSQGTANQKGDASSLLDDGQSKDTHNSHTRRCREKVNSKFRELLSVLPSPPPKTGIKHKAQILDYAIRVYRDIHARKTLLEAELALSSRSQLNAWVEGIVMRSTTLQDALAPYLSLVCTKGGWKYSEAWIPAQEPMQSSANMGKVEGMSGESTILTPATLVSGPTARLRLGLAVIPSLGNTDDPDLQSKLERFRDKSRSYQCKARVDLPGRVMCTMRPEWLPSLGDQEAFQRARLAHNSTLVVCFGVPVFVRGHIAAVAVFFDTEQRPYDAKCVDLADNIAGLLGNAFGASAKFRTKPL